MSSDTDDTNKKVLQFRRSNTTELSSEEKFRQRLVRDAQDRLKQNEILLKHLGLLKPKKPGSTGGSTPPTNNLY